MDANGVRTLVDLLTLAHLHTTRAVIPMQVICVTSLSSTVDLLSDVIYSVLNVS